MEEARPAFRQGGAIYESSDLCHIGCEDVLPRMDELSSLVLDGLDHLRMTVPCRHNADSCTKLSVVGLQVDDWGNGRPLDY